MGTTWKNLLPAVKKSDRILLFYTENSPYISYPDLTEIIQHVGKFDMIKCYKGVNGLDFQLCSELGYLLRGSSKSEFIIFSNDNGYDAAVKYWTDKKREVSRMTTQALNKELEKPSQEQTAQTKQKQPAAKKEKREKPVLQQQEETAKSPVAAHQGTILEFATAGQKQSAQSKEEKQIDIIRNVLPSEVEMEDIRWLQKIMMAYKNNSQTRLRQIYGEMIRKFGNAEGQEYYRILKKHVKEIYNVA